MKVWVTGGYFDASGECFVEEIDLAAGTRRTLLQFVPPPPHLVPTKGFTGGCWLDDSTLLVCSFNAVWRIDVATWQCTGRLFQPDFNDLHHVFVDADRGHIYVCNTGLDSIDVFNEAGRFLARHTTSPAWFEAQRQVGNTVSRANLATVLTAGWGPKTDPELVQVTDSYYGGHPADFAFSQRIVRDFVHPNHVVRLGGRLAVTCLATREVRCFWTQQVLCQLDGHPHDGAWADGLFWTTCTNGLITAWRLGDGLATAVETLSSAATGHLGWCRGLHVSSDGLAVGLTAIQGQPQYHWRTDDPKSSESSVLWLDRVTGHLRGRVDLSDPVRRTKIFSILAPKGG